jgi:hypothetical protein
MNMAETAWWQGEKSIPSVTWITKLDFSRYVDPNSLHQWRSFCTDDSSIQMFTSDKSETPKMISISSMLCVAVPYCHPSTERLGVCKGMHSSFVLERYTVRMQKIHRPSVWRGTMLQVGRSRIRDPMRWKFFFSIYLILPAAVGPGVHSASNRNE